MSFERNLAYEASAGSGKTFMLVVRYLSLLFMGADPAKILALTFTNKAAGEMQERIMTTLGELESRDELEAIARNTALSKAEILQKKDAVLRRFLKSHTKIMTIDSFFTKILRKFSLYVALMPDFETLSSQHEIKLLEQFLKEVEVSNNRRRLIALSLESKKRLFDLFVLLDEFYVKSKELASFSFTPKSKEPLEEEALAIISQMRSLVTSAQKPSKNALNAFVVERFEDILSKSWLGRETLDYRTFSKCYTPRLDELLHRLYEVLAEWFVAKEQSFFHALSSLASIYQSAKRALYKAENEVSFNDVTMLVFEILRESVDTDFLYFRLDAQIEHILLDEFQDTSILQYEILHPLIQEALSGKGVKEEGSFFFVGDTKQSIYRFRGGVSSLFNEVARLNNTKIEKLTTNYRSQRAVVEFVNDTFREKIAGYTDQKVKEGAEGGYVEVLKSDDVVESACKKVHTLLEAGAQQSDIALLCFTNADGEVLKESLQKKGYDVVTETTVKLIHQRSVRALLEYLKYLYFKERIFKENFFALIGREVDVAFVDFNEVPLAKIVKDAIERYSLFAEDFNLFLFLELLGRYESIEELLFNYERIETEALGSSTQGIRILTVHKSKGLEYEHVVVVDRLGSPPPAREPIIFDYEGIELQNIYLRIKGRDKIDRQYASSLERAAKLRDEDTLNALYVAFTRAKRDLFVIAKPKKSVFELLELTEQSRGELQHLPKRAELQTRRAQSAGGFAELYYGSQSDLLGGAKESKEEELASIHFGLGLHYMLEMMEEFTKESIPQAYDALRNRYGMLLESEELEEIARRVSMLIDCKEFQKLLGTATYAKEQPLKYGKNLYYIDLLIRSDSGYTVIDYKSGKKFHDEHIRQVEGYKRAIKSITHKPVQGYLCYLLEDGVELVKV